MTPAIASLRPELVPLTDGRAGLRAGLCATVQSAAPAQATIDFTASDESLDRYDEVISAAGWRLDAYRRNPVFQNAHQTGDVLFTLGKALVTEVRDGRLFQRVQFAVEANPFARIAYELYRGGFLRAVSVGFIPLRWEDGRTGDAYRRRYLEQELVEVSAVGIPANPNALALACRAAHLSSSDLRRLLLDLEARAKTAGPASSHLFPLLRFARELRRILCGPLPQGHSPRAQSKSE
jgi:HK97 family phage prohead protease